MHLDSPIAQTLLASARQENHDAELRLIAVLAREAAGRAVRTAIQRELAACGLTESGFNVMAVLSGRDPEPILRSDLGVAAGLSPMRVTDALTRLEMSGLVQRRRDAEDRRLVWLQLTPAGRQQTTEALRRYVAAAVRVTESLNTPELESCVLTSGKLQVGAEQLSHQATVPVHA